MSTCVSMDNGRKALFPDRCILCGQRGPGGSFAMSAGATSWRELAGAVPQGEVLRVPACARCRELLDRQRHLRGLGMLLGALVAATCYGVLLFCYHGPLLNMVRASGLAFFMLPYLVWEAVFPLPLSISTARHRTTFRFEQELYAIEFARLNGSADAAERIAGELSDAEDAALAEAIASLSGELKAELRQMR